MRRIVGNPALEQEELQRQEQTQRAEQEQCEREQAENISLEEEQLLLGTAGEAATQSANDLAETDRILEVSDALEDLAIVAGEIKEAKDSDIDLIESAGQMAVAGTDIAVEELLPCLEDFSSARRQFAAHAEAAKAAGGQAMQATGIKLDGAVSSLKKTAKQIWERIMAFLKKIWEAIQDFFENTFAVIPAMEKRLRELKKMVSEAKSGARSVEKIKLNVGASSLAINGKVVSGEGELLAAVPHLVHAAEWVYGAYLQSLHNRGQALAKAIDAFQFQDAAKSALVVKKACSDHSIAQVPGHGTDSSARFPGFYSRSGDPLLGNVSLVSKTYVENDQDASVLGALERHRKSGVQLLATTEEAIAREYELEVITPAAADALIKDAEQLLRVLAGYKAGYKRYIAETLKDLQKASNDLASKANTVESGVDGNVDARVSNVQIACYRAALNFNESFARWSRDPATSMMSSALGTVRALSFVIMKSMMAYGAQQAGGKEKEKAKA